MNTIVYLYWMLFIRGRLQDVNYGAWNIVLSCPSSYLIFILFKTWVSSWSNPYVHLVKLEPITLYCPKNSPKFVESDSHHVSISTCTVQKLSPTVPISTCTYPKINFFCWKNHHVLSRNFTWFCQIDVLYCPKFDLYCPKIVLYCPNFNLYLPTIQLNLLEK